MDSFYGDLARSGFRGPSSSKNGLAKTAFFRPRQGVRSDASLVPPIRQTASIFKQPVTVYKTQESKVKTDLKHGTQEKPKQLFWEKRLEGLTACDADGQTGTKQSILENPGVFLNPEQPLIASVTITKDDVRRQEERVRRARQRLREALAVV
ncbi:hypothetical protein SFRURICE_002989 [Spodoptera frugiperda]|nr:hypothetical protein SFRURICE_002989 [Spodoptera frugiperda]